MRTIAVGMMAAVLIGILPAQTEPPRSFVGTITAFNRDTDEITIQPDKQTPTSVKVSNETVAQKVAPGERNLKNARAIQLTQLAVGDRVLVTVGPGTAHVLRIIVMSAADIVRRNDADRLDWSARGIAGIVSARQGGRITLKVRTFQGETQATVILTDHTTYRRYLPDSVKFADATISNPDEIAIGDQLRARGQKSEDGLQVTAEDVVFGTFLTKAGSIVSVNPGTNEIGLKELGTGKLLIVKLTADSQIKKMPDFTATPASGGRPGFPPGSGPSTGVAPGGGPGLPPGGPPGMAPGRPPAGPDLAEMLERLPAARPEELSPGERVAVSSTKGTRSDQITAIMLLAHADMLIEMASRKAGGAGTGAEGSSALNPSGMGSTANAFGLELPAMGP